MSEFPGTKDAANIGFALVDELIRTLIARNVITETDLTSMLEAGAARMEASKKADAMMSAAQIRNRLLGKQ